MTIPEQIALATIFYYGQVFVFCSLINKKSVVMVSTKNMERTYSEQIY